MTYEEIKSNYVKGLWSIQLVRVAVKKGLITPIQYKEITGSDY
ncbi:MAG: XkdX family protein [Lachnospiraceae bacterium]|nr:XkdX family protein [Lachnospiraceae bacterium]